MEKFLFFWGHTPGKVTNKSCLSQWYDRGFKVDDIFYKTAEHYMMYRKAELFKDFTTGLKILQADTPKEAKALGREVANYVDAEWVAVRYNVLYDANMFKFGQNKDLADFLMSTEGTLVEASPYDSIYGIGLRAESPLAADRRTWQGLNILGYVLMDVRHRLIQWAINHTDTLLFDIFEVSDHVENKRSLEKVMPKLTEELGELSTEVQIHLGDCYKDAGPDGVVGEAVDLIIATVDVIRLHSPQLSTRDISCIAETKLAKWSAKDDLLTEIKG